MINPFKIFTKNKHSIQSELKKGDSIVVKAGTMDPDYNYDISGYTGIISEIDHDNNLVTIEWSGRTLREIPERILQESEKEGFDWSSMNLYGSDVELSKQHESIDEKERTYDEISRKVWLYSLGNQGVRIINILQEVKVMTNDEECLNVWLIYLQKHISFPFEANIVEFDSVPFFQKNTTITALSLCSYSEVGGGNEDGIHIKVKFGREKFSMPLANVEAKDKKSRLHEIIDDYSTWFANSRE